MLFLGLLGVAVVNDGNLKVNQIMHSLGWDSKPLTSIYAPPYDASTNIGTKTGGQSSHIALDTSSGSGRDLGLEFLKVCIYVVVNGKDSVCFTSHYGNLAVCVRPLLEKSCWFAVAALH